MAVSLRPKLFSPQSALALIAQASARLGLTQQALRMLAGSIMPKFHPQLSRYEPTEHDVFVATFAKSGTNWAMQICLQIAHRGTAEFGHIHDVVAWPEAPYRGIVPLHDPSPWRSASTGMRVIKTHLWAPAVPYDPAAKYVTIIRDPKEVMVSAYHFFLGIVGIRDRISPSEWVDVALAEDALARQWAEHSASFWAWRDKPNVFVRSFGEIKGDHEGTVDALSELMGVELTPDERAAVIERSTFAYMKSIDERFGPPRTPLVGDDQHPSMMRRGAAGKSSELIDDQERARIDEVSRRCLLRLGSDLPYDELFGSA